VREPKGSCAQQFANATTGAQVARAETQAGLQFLPWHTHNEFQELLSSPQRQLLAGAVKPDLPVAPKFSPGQMLES